eukprot:jgi/Tetstr1/437637/TSEL_026304.t1
MEADFGAEGIDFGWEELRRESSAAVAARFPCSVALGGLPTRTHREAGSGAEGLGDEVDGDWEVSWEEDEEGEEEERRASEREASRVLSHAPGHARPRPQLLTPTQLAARSGGHKPGGHVGGVGRKHSGKKKRRRGRTYAGGIAVFLRTVLQWPAHTAAMASRQSLGLPPLGGLQATYTSAEAYYAAIDELAVEETRAALHQAMTGRGPSGRGGHANDDVDEEDGASVGRRQPELQLQLEVEEVSAFELPELSVVRFRLTTPLREKRVREVSLPGWVLSLQAMQSAVGSAPLGGAPKRRRGADGLSTWAGGAAPRAQPGSPPVLGSVMNRSVDADAVWLSVVVPYRLLDPQKLSKGSRWAATALASVIVQQRQSATAYERPTTPFMYRLLGGQAARHQKFDSSSGSESDSDSDAVESESDHAAGPNGSVGDTNYARPLNPAQAGALRRCIDAPEGSVELVQGPPGCGKTHWLSASVAALLSPPGAVRGHKPPRLLIAAPSNKAVAVVLAACAEAAPEHRDGFALLGVEEALSATTGESAATQDVGTARNDDPLLRPGLANLVADTFVYGKAERLASRALELGSRLSEMAGVVEVRFCTDEDCARLVRVSHTESCAAVCADVDAALAAASCCIGALNAASPRETDSSGVASALAAAAAELCAARTWWDAVLTAPWPCERRRLETQERLGKAGQLAARAGSVLRDALAKGPPERVAKWAEALLSSAPAVFCTLGSAGGGLLRRAAPVDILLVDEAAQALEGDLVLAFTAHPRRAILVGDPAQLPATLLSLEAAKLQRSRSAMARLMNCGAPVALLDTQYRMHPDIAAFPSATFYDGALRTAPANADRITAFSRIPASSAWPARYCLLDVVGSEQALPSIANRAEACTAAALVTMLASRLGLAVSRQVQIICFYKAQVTAVRRALKASGMKHLCAVATVDSFQGSEADVCIVSMGRCNSAGRVGFLKDRQRLNVALTRARHACYILASASTLLRSDSSDLRSLVKDAQSRGCLLPAAEVLAAFPG